MALGTVGTRRRLTSTMHNGKGKGFPIQTRTFKIKYLIIFSYQIILPTFHFYHKNAFFMLVNNYIWCILADQGVQNDIKIA